MATFSYGVDWAAQEESEPRVLTAKFGDGYEQRSADGINTDLKTWQVQFKNRDDSEAAAIVAFFAADAGVTSFDWTPPGGSAGKYVCSRWTRSPTQVDRNTITAVFREVAE